MTQQNIKYSHISVLSLNSYSTWTFSKHILLLPICPFKSPTNNNLPFVGICLDYFIQELPRLPFAILIELRVPAGQNPCKIRTDKKFRLGVGQNHFFLIGFRVRFRFELTSIQNYKNLFSHLINSFLYIKIDIIYTFFVIVLYIFALYKIINLERNLSYDHHVLYKSYILIRFRVLRFDIKLSGLKW